MGSLAVVSNNGRKLKELMLAEIAAACLLGINALNENGMFHGVVE